MCGTDNRDHRVKHCLNPRWEITGLENWPCQPHAQKPPGCLKRVLWLWQVREMPDKGHEPSPLPPLGGREKPRQSQQIKMNVFIPTNSNLCIRLGIEISWKAHSMLFNIIIPSDTDVTSYLNCSLGILEYNIHYSCNTGVDKKITRTFFEGQVRLKKQKTINASRQPWKSLKWLHIARWLWKTSQYSVMVFWEPAGLACDIKGVLWTLSLLKILLHRSLAVI